MREHDANAFAPSQYQIISYLLELTDNLKSPTSVLNYLSGARTFVRAFGGSVAGFDTYPVSLARRGVQRLSHHVPALAPPLTPQDIKAVVRFFSSIGDNGLTLTAALLLGYFTLLRQSNLLSVSPHQTSEHTIRVKDITSHQGGLNVHIRSSKTLLKSASPLDIHVPRIPGSPYCPVAAWSRYLTTLKPYAEGPAFITKDGSPLCPRALRDTLRLALSAEGHPCPGAITLHSLRRGGAQACARQGASLGDIKELGHWSSDAVFTYVPRAAISAAGQTLSSIFA